MPKRLLLVDPIPTHRIRLKAVLRMAQYDIVSVDRIACISGAVASGPVDMILLNTSGVDPSAMMTRLRKTQGTSDIPVLCRDDDAGPVRRMQALSTGALDMIATSAPPQLLLARLRGLLREADMASEVERRRLAAASFGFRESSSPYEGPHRHVLVSLGTSDSELATTLNLDGHRIQSMTVDTLLREETPGNRPDVITIEIGDGKVDDLEAILPEIRMRDHLRRSSVLVLYPEERCDIALRALNLGAAEIAGDRSTGDEIAQRIAAIVARKRDRDALRKSTEESFRLATIDSLTGLYNRRYAEVYLSDAMLNFMETGRSLCVMIIDIDHFKNVNDCFGHQTGDLVLREIAKRLRENLRAMDLVARIGGEEFLVALPEMEAGEAESTAERLRREIAGCSVAIPEGGTLSVTVSIGLAAARIDEVSRAFDPVSATGAGPAKGVVDEILARADAALYAAKRAGRNQIAVSPPAASAA